jgi:hypothetical protein
VPITWIWPEPIGEECSHSGRRIEKVLRRVKSSRPR